MMLAYPCDEVAAQVMAGASTDFRDISREELLDEIEAFVADVCGILGREV
jgi:hypothetical protein